MDKQHQLTCKLDTRVRSLRLDGLFLFAALSDRMTNFNAFQDVTGPSDIGNQCIIVRQTWHCSVTLLQRCNLFAANASGRIKL